MAGFGGSVSPAASSWRTDSPLTESDRESGGSPELVSFAALKLLATEMLERHSLLRMLVLAEPDLMQREQALAKVQVFTRIPYEELTRK